MKIPLELYVFPDGKVLLTTEVGIQKCIDHTTSRQNLNSFVRDIIIKCIHTSDADGQTARLNHAADMLSGKPCGEVFAPNNTTLEKRVVKTIRKNRDEIRRILQPDPQLTKKYWISGCAGGFSFTSTLDEAIARACAYAKRHAIKVSLNTYKSRELIGDVDCAGRYAKIASNEYWIGIACSERGRQYIGGKDGALAIAAELAQQWDKEVVLCQREPRCIVGRFTKTGEFVRNEPDDGPRKEYWLQKKGLPNSGLCFTGTYEEAVFQTMKYAQRWDWNAQLSERNPRIKVGWATRDGQFFKNER